MDRPSNSKRRFAKEVVERLQQAGFQALWAGGCVRDLVMGNEPTDYDVATNARPAQVRRLFRRTVPVGVSFGVIVVVGHEDEGQIEVATFRTEGPYSDGRHPDRVEFATAEADAQRRDFTINGMFFDPVHDKLHDFVGGQQDIAARVVRAIGDPRARFREDKLRLLRAVRFAARFGFELDPATADAIREMASEIVIVSAERIQQELQKMLVDRNRVRALRLADAMGLLRVVLPDVHAAHGVPQSKPKQPDGDLWEHTLLVLEQLDSAWEHVNRNVVSAPGPVPPLPSTLAFAAVLHDVGKPETMGHNGTKHTFYHHEQHGRRIAERLCRWLRMSNDESERVAWLVEYHQYLGEAKAMRDSKLKRTLVHPGIVELLALHRADALASTGDTQHVDFCEWMLRELPADELNPPPLVTGHDLMRLGLEPGPLFKTLLDRVRDAQLERTIRSKKDALALVETLSRELRGEKAE